MPGDPARYGADDYHGMASACLIATDRYQDQERELRPAPARGDLVVCDRYIASSLTISERPRDRGAHSRHERQDGNTQRERALFPRTAG
ncbi:hypothetical protein ABZ595_13920 [Streptomyces rubradiris]|uniref:hypothetical protein n=1 Tax=Streptomyces rubradiris TaxID=285531 RepID=UPI0033F66F6C